MTTSPIREAAALAVYVDDQDAALRWYTEVLGFALARDVTYSDGTRWIEVRPPGGSTPLALALPDALNEGEVGGFTRMLLATDDIDAAYAELRGRGVEFAAPVLRAGDELPPMVVLADPDGNRFLLVERPA
jgi:catechol 2,3-dioxygenase-like lactoylglutathione lyase family enzyme